AGHEVALLHGGLSRAERAAALAAFEERRHILIATDAASEGLNLHRNCHVVVHYELPWNSARLEQRAGRLDRLGQTRRVHEILLVAADTAERLVFAPLARRARAGRSSDPSLRRLAGVMDESRVAKAVMEGAGPEEPDGSVFDIFATGAAVRPAAGLAGEAAAEALRLQRERASRPVAVRRPRGSRSAVSLLETRRSALPPGAWFVYSVSLRAWDGSLVARHGCCVGMALQGPDGGGRSSKAVGLSANTVIAELGPASRAAALKAADIGMRQAESFHRHCVDAGIRRERAIAAALPSTARRLVQSGLFDRRVLHAETVRREIADALLEDSQARLRVLEQSRLLTTTCVLEAVLLTRRRGR
ncbi:MAG: helicase-related protein, partial [Acidobacteriota bacterium]